MKPRLLYVSPTAGFFLSHRLPLAKAALAAGYEVALASPGGNGVKEVEAAGLTHLDVPIRRGFARPDIEARSFLALWRIFRRWRPDVAHLITAKPALHGGIAARLAGVPTVSAITGLGFIFMREDWRARAVRAILMTGYRFGLARQSNHFIFQNPDDAAIFRSRGLLDRAGMTMIPGSGADLVTISPRPLPDGVSTVVLPSRMLADKGVREFVEAARLLRTSGIEARYVLLGDPDPDNPASLDRSELEALAREGVVEWHRHTDDIAQALGAAHIVALPSYREGFPKTLIDAAAAGRVSVTTDVPGCRDAIVNGKTGLLCRPRDCESLADRLRELLLDRTRIETMGNAARLHAERHFDIRKVIATHLNLYEKMRGMHA